MDMFSTSTFYLRIADKAIPNKKLTFLHELRDSLKEFKDFNNFNWSKYCYNIRKCGQKIVKGYDAEGNQLWEVTWKEPIKRKTHS